jgi:hypothetical protein
MQAIDTLLDLSRWQTALVVVSLDRGLPFWRAMKLEVPDPANVRRAAQVAVEGLWTSGRSPEEVQSLVEAFLARVERESGEAAGHAVLRWADGVFAMAYQSVPGAQSFLWGPLLKALSGLQPGRPVAQLEIDSSKRATLTEELRTILSQGLTSADFRVQVPSEWDRAVDMEYEGGSAMDWVTGTCRFVNTQCALNVLASLEPVQMRALMTWAAQQASLYGIDPELLQEPRAIPL